MKAFNVVNLVQGSDEWLEWRKSGVTATDSVILDGVSPYKTEWRLWAEKTGYCSEVDLDGNPLVIRGREQEPVARAASEAYFKDVLIPICAQSVKWPWLIASLDAINSEAEPVELKVPSQKVWEAILAEGTASEAYRMYEVQVAHQALVLGAARGWLVFYNNGEIIPFEVIPTKERLVSILKNAKEFLVKLETKEEPVKDVNKDWFIPKGEEAEKWANLSQSYRTLDAQAKELKDKLKVLEQRKKDISTLLQEQMGPYLQADYGGLQVTRYTRKKIDYESMVNDGVLSLHDKIKYTVESESCRVTVNHESALPKYVKDEEAIEPLQGLASESKALIWHN